MAASPGGSADVTASTHPILSSAYEDAQPRCWPDRPTPTEFTFVSESDSATIEELSSRERIARSRDASRSPSDTRSDVRRSGAASQVSGTESGARRRAAESVRGSVGDSATAASDSDDEPAPRPPARSLDEQTAKWSASSGAHESSFRLKSPDRPMASPHRLGTYGLAASRASACSSAPGEAAAPPALVIAGTARRQATLAALREMQDSPPGQRSAGVVLQ